MAQLVEHMLGKHEVPGPNPGSSSKHPRGFSSGLWFFMRVIDFAVALPRAMGCFGVLPSRTGDRHARRLFAALVFRGRKTLSLQEPTGLLTVRIRVAAPNTPGVFPRGFGFL